VPAASDAAIGPKLGEGREAEVYLWGHDAVLKLYRPGFGGHHHEALALVALAGHGIAPELIRIVEHDGRKGLVLQRLDGVDLLALLQQRPWQVFGSARVLAEAHLAMHRIAAPAGLPDIRQVLHDRINDAKLTRNLRDFALGLLDGLPAGDRLCHGDLHPGNVLLVNGRPSVIDWAAATHGVPQADHARTMLLLRWANPLPGTPPFFRALIASGRRLLTRRYLRTYRHSSPDTVQHHDSWLTVNVAARLSEGIDAERPVLLSLLSDALRRAHS
jgi:hypothetical protein